MKNCDLQSVCEFEEFTKKNLLHLNVEKKDSSNSRFPVPQWGMSKIMVVSRCICICTLIPFISNSLN